jgi:hypothetical protein
MSNLARKFIGIIILLLALGCRGSDMTVTPNVTSTSHLTSTSVLPTNTFPPQTTTPTGTPIPSSNNTSEPTGTPASTPSQVESNNLVQALSALPVGANHVEFTNWTFIKEYEGFQDVTSASSEEEWVEFLLTVDERHAAPIVYGRRNLSGHAELWGWDATDLNWEAGVQITVPPGYVLKFRDDFDFTPVIARFEERDFTASVYQGVMVYTHTHDLSLEWLVFSEFSILNTAVLTDANMLIMSISLENVHNMLDAYYNRAPSLVDNPTVQVTLDTLGDVGAAFISAEACAALSSEAIVRSASLPETAEQMKAQLSERPPLQEYETFGLGYRYEDAQPVGLIVMHFSDPKQAREDLQPRRQLAVDGLVRDPDPQTYSEAYFTLDKASVRDNQIIFKVTPFDNKPRWFFGMVLRGDMSFATCP